MDSETSKVGRGRTIASKRQHSHFRPAQSPGFRLWVVIGQMRFPRPRVHNAAKLNNVAVPQIQLQRLSSGRGFSAILRISAGAAPIAASGPAEDHQENGLEPRDWADRFHSEERTRSHFPDRRQLIYPGPLALYRFSSRGP